MRISDWSSDVCSSDLARGVAVAGCRLAGGADRPPGHRDHRIGGEDHDEGDHRRHPRSRVPRPGDRKSVVEGKSVSVRVDLGGRRIIKKNKQQTSLYHLLSLIIM